MDNDVIFLNTDDKTAVSADGTLWGNRLLAYSQYDVPSAPLCSIFITGYNRLHKTKYAVECVLKYTTDIDYELILIDNGSSDGTFEYFQSVEHPKKRIIKVSKNIGGGFSFGAIRKVYSGKYLVGVSNDVYVTANWLSNLLRCFESDPRIGFVEPLSSNISNLQQYDLGGWKDFDEMQGKAASFNISDPSKWEERMRLISILSIFSRQVLDSVGIGDFAFVHDFSEDDLTARLRRMGYKLMLCKDTWVCHDHDLDHMEDKDPAAFRASLESGRRLYREKYHGIDPWDDINNYELQLLAPLGTWDMPQGEISALCVDARCGTPVLEIRNRLRRRGRLDVSNWAFTTRAKYFLDLQTTEAEVKCDRVDFIQNHYADETFDIVALCEPLNCYHSAPITLLQSLYNFAKRGGILLFKLRNTSDYNALMRVAGFGGANDEDCPAVMSIDEVSKALKLFGGKNISIGGESYRLSQDDLAIIKSWLGKVNPNYNNQNLQNLTIKDYMFSVSKG
ncbi:MAG: glycosyltransferase family 2 protein [Clostridiales bacterium]|jgi:GT2 family glycosyltransferase|nr:glycosyltransferase family 2 protein [Clostridiales bacterium]